MTIAIQRSNGLLSILLKPVCPTPYSGVEKAQAITVQSIFTEIDAPQQLAKMKARIY
jgi:hypothetical protein